MKNFGGAMDLSSLGGDESGIVVAAWLVPADQNTLREYLALSEKVPVLMLISDDSQDSKDIRSMLEKVLTASEGKFIGLDVSLSSSPQLAQAVGVSSAPAMLAILAGQPAPLFQGAIQQQQLLQVLSQVLQLAQQNGITGSAKVGKKEEVKPLSKDHQEAIAAIEKGKLEEAAKIFQKILIEYPNDNDAKAGLAQVELMVRLQGKNLDDLDKLMLGADQLLASRNPSAAFSHLLDLFAERIDDRERIRARLIQLFFLLGDSDPAVLDARRRLASMMF
ncbi:MAG: tetratricopeptide repeat protein [Aquiluna sp.]|jgi:putative thioredoxin